MKLSDVLKRQEQLKEQKENLAKPLTGGKTYIPKAVDGKKSIVKVLRVRETPNIHALQFVLNAHVLKIGKRNYVKPEDCAGDRMAEELLSLEFVKSAFVMENFVTVSKDPAVEWSEIKVQIWKIIDRFISYYESTDKDKLDVKIFKEQFLSLSHEDKLKAIEAVLDRSIRANLARDGGGVEVKGLEDNVILIHYEGACGSCVTAGTGTLQFIQQQVQHQLDSSLEVKPV